MLKALLILCVIAGILYSTWYRTRTYPDKKLYFLSVIFAPLSLSYWIAVEAFGISSSEDKVLSAVLIAISIVSFGLAFFFGNKYWKKTQLH